MATQVFCVTFDCHDPVQMAEFWATALSFGVDVRWEGFGEVVIEDRAGKGPTVMFMKVPE